jgi:hypothetical protein
MTEKENPTNSVTLFQNVIGHTSSKRVSGITCLLVGVTLLSYNILFGIHNQTAVEFSKITDAISIFFWAGSGLLGVSVTEYFGKLNPFKK